MESQNVHLYKNEVCEEPQLIDENNTKLYGNTEYVNMCIEEFHSICQTIHTNISKPKSLTFKWIFRNKK